MIKLDNRAITTPFATLDIGDTFIGDNGKYYIKTPRVMKYNFFNDGPYNAVCITDGNFAYVVDEQPVTIVNIEGVVVP